MGEAAPASAEAAEAAVRPRRLGCHGPEHGARQAAHAQDRLWSWRRHNGALAVVAGKDLAAFDARLKTTSTVPRLLETVSGFNYSRGHKEDLRLYTTGR